MDISAIPAVEIIFREKVANTSDISKSLSAALADVVYVLQSIGNGASDDPQRDAEVLLRKMYGELSGYGNSFSLEQPKQDS